MRLRKVKNALEKIQEYPNIVIQDAVSNKGKWNTIFKNDNPIYLEIGMGKGKFIIENAKRNPNINYIGLEVAESVLVRALEKLIDEPLPNLILLHEDAFELNNIFEDGEIDKIFLTFSDPWPKSRHAKRRLTCSNILNSYRKALKIDGSLEFKTDNRKLFEYSILEFIKNGLEFKELSLNLHEDKEDIITTEYEDKFVAKGNVIYFVEVTKQHIQNYKTL